jgi:CheY-like chemotaxis protein
MRRVLLVLEDYNELLFLETLLKKLGFDVESIRNEVSLSEKIMGFAPDLIVATGDGHKINGTRVAQKIKKRVGQTRLLLIFPRQKLQQGATETFAADGVIESPLNPRSIITSICQLTGVSPDSIMIKFEKLPIAQDYPAGEGIQIIGSRMAAPKKSSATASAAAQAPANAHVTGKSAAQSTRAERYAAILKDAPQSKINGFKHEFIQDEIAEIRKDEQKWKAIDEERKAFVVALFKKK